MAVVCDSGVTSAVPWRQASREYVDCLCCLTFPVAVTGRFCLVRDFLCGGLTDGAATTIALERRNACGALPYHLVKLETYTT
jgi:hypothetical protein